MTEKEGMPVESGKRTNELEVVIKWLKEENRSLITKIDVLEKPHSDESREKANQIHKLKRQITALKGIEDMWSILEFEKGKLEMDLEAAEAENNALHKALEQDWLTKVVQVAENLARKERLEVEELSQKIHVLEKDKGELKAQVQKLEREITEEQKRVLDEKSAMEAKEQKIAELVQGIEELKKENVTIKLKGEKTITKLGNRIGILEKERQRLEEEYKQRIDVINVLVQEKECVDDKLKRLKMEINTRAVNVKLEGNAELPQNQGKRRQSLLENSSGGDRSTGNSSTAKRTRPSR